MEENVNYAFNEKVGEITCQSDNRLWLFTENEEKVIIPIKSVSNVCLKQKRSYIWLLLLFLSLAFAATGSFFGEDGSEWLFYGIAIVLLIVAIIMAIFSVEYTLQVIPHSGISQQIVTRKRATLEKLYTALVDSLRRNL